MRQLSVRPVASIVTLLLLVAAVPLGAERGVQGPQPFGVNAVIVGQNDLHRPSAGSGCSASTIAPKRCSFLRLTEAVARSNDPRIDSCIKGCSCYDLLEQACVYAS